jgi:hypothetical protein
MGKRKLTPEEREARRRRVEQSRKARAQLQAAMDNATRFLEQRKAERERKRHSLRYRLNPFRRAA